MKSLTSRYLILKKPRMRHSIIGARLRFVAFTRVQASIRRLQLGFVSFQKTKMPKTFHPYPFLDIGSATDFLAATSKTRHLIIATFTASFRTRHETIA